MMTRLTSLLMAALPLLGTSQAQGDPVLYTDRQSGITFNTWPTKDVTFGFALPANALTTDATEFLGILTCTSRALNTGWCGLSLGGGMTNNLLLLAYPSQNRVLTSFLWAPSYSPPTRYLGPALLTQVSSSVNSTHYSVLFRCHRCLSWSQDGVSGSASTKEGFLVVGWAHSTSSPSGNLACPADVSVRRHVSEGMYGAPLVGNVANPSYAAWAAKATSVVAGSCGGGPVAVPTTGTLTERVRTSVTALPPPATTGGPPTPRPPMPTARCSRTYRVVAGDYCYLIATNNGLTLDQFMVINPGLECFPLQIGTVVCVRQG